MNPLLVFLLCAGLLNETDPQRNGKAFEEYADEIVQQPPNDPVRVHRYSYKDRTSPISPTRHVSFVRTDNYPPAVEDQFVKTEWHYTDLHGNYPGSPPENEYVIDCYLPEGNEFQKPVYFYPPPGNDPYLKFAPGEMGPGMLIISDDDDDASPSSGYTQTIQLKKGWNLVSWHLNVPDGDLQPPYDLEIGEVVTDPDCGAPIDPDIYFPQGGDELFGIYWYEERDNYYPIDNRDWHLKHAYYFNTAQTLTWSKTFDRFAPPPPADTIKFIPDEAWDTDPDLPEGEFASYWFFMGFTAPGYCKLASVPDWPTYTGDNGDPERYSFEGPFHWLVWHDSDPNYSNYDLKIIKTDDGKVYIPDPSPVRRRGPVDQIGALEPGRGYFLGFSNNAEYVFEGWDSWPQWQNGSCVPPNPKENQSAVASSSHFQYHPCTHWSYPVVIDTVDTQACSLAVGDEIGVFDGELCVGAGEYEGQFPLVITCWEDDIATPGEIDGYVEGHEMTCLWYDASTNAEAELVLPAGSYAVADDPVAPTHSGFGRGLYARRSFTEGIGTVMQLPTEYMLGQCYPNPFNVETMIPLELPERSQITIELFNVRGQSLGVIYRGIENAGWRKLRYNAVNLSSGLYFYQMQAQGLEHGREFVAVNKMLLLK